MRQKLLTSNMFDVDILQCLRHYHQKVYKLNRECREKVSPEISFLQFYLPVRQRRSCLGVISQATRSKTLQAKTPLWIET